MLRSCDVGNWEIPGLQSVNYNCTAYDVVCTNHNLGSLPIVTYNRTLSLGLEKAASAPINGK